MIFKTIYGPELESIFLWILKFNKVDEKELLECFGGMIGEKKSSIINIKDALIFLQSAQLLYKEDDLWTTNRYDINQENFKIKLIKNLRKIQLEDKDSIDAKFIGFLEQLYIKKDKLFLKDLYQKINEISIDTSISEEKVNAWKRVLEYLEIGNRCYSGLRISYSENLLKQILIDWDEDEGPLQYFLESHVDKYIPWKNSKGEISKVLVNTLEQLEEKNIIKLIQKQDLPARSYLQSRQIKWIQKGELYENTMC